MDDVPTKMPWQVRAYDAARRLYDGARRRRLIFGDAAPAVFAGTWLGLLDRDALHAADDLYYHRARMYHTDSHNLSGLFAWEDGAFERHFQKCRSLIVTAAGGGREVIALARRGLEVHAFECHPELVEIANELLSQQGLRARVALAPRDDCPPWIPTCDGAIVGWSSHMLMQQRTSRIRFLQQLRLHMPPGAPVLLSFFTRTEDTRHLRLTAAIANAFRSIRRGPRAEIGDDLIPNFVHYFTEAEIAGELQAGGFRLVEFSQDGPHAVAYAVEVEHRPAAGSENP